LPSKALSACLDANVLISAIAFGGKPNQVLEALFERQFGNVTCAEIMAETRRNLLNKVGLAPVRVHTVMDLILARSTVIEPQGIINAAQHGPDNLVLETALLGGCDVLVTGDKRHLLPLNPYKGLIIEPPSAFLKRLY